MRSGAPLPHQPDPFEALADPTRRAILGLLSTGEQTAGQLAGAFPHISRPAVSRHLKVLRQSGLVVTRRAGREWRYGLNGRQLAAVYLGWFAQFAPTWEEALRNLKNRAESGLDRSERR